MQLLMQLLIIMTVLIVVTIGYVGLDFYGRNKAKKDEYYKKLARYVGDTCISWCDINTIRKFFREHPNELEKAEALCKIDEENKYRFMEAEKRDLIKHRVLAYDYEDMLYQIYAPFAVEKKGKWIPTGLTKEFVIKRISEIKEISYEESLRIYEILTKNTVLHENQNKGEFVYLSFMFRDDSMSNSDWKVVSDTDITFNKWMEIHGYIHNTSK